MRRALQPWSLAGFAAMAMVVFALKSHYSGASAGQLSWILAPTSWLVSLMVGADFVYEAGTGWFSPQEMFAIAPECAGVNFLLASFLTLAVASVLRLRSPGLRAVAIPLSLVGAYLATIAVNALRICIALRASSVGSSFFTGHALHRAQGITVFFTALYLLYLAADTLLPSRDIHAA